LKDFIVIVSELCGGNSYTLKSGMAASSEVESGGM